MSTQIRERSPFISDALSSRGLQLGSLDAPVYYPHRMTAQEANILPWNEFKGRLNPFATVQRKNSECITEYLFTPKSPPWTHKDFTVFVGSPDKPIATIADLTIEEGKFFFYTHFLVAERILSESDRESHFTIGFNTEDSLPGHHSIRTRLHSHIYIADNDEVRSAVTPVRWRDLNWFDRLRFMEPSVAVARDFLRHQIKLGLFQDRISDRNVYSNPGYISINLDMTEKNHLLFEDVQQLFMEMEEEYHAIEFAFTNKQIDETTGRYIPRIESERLDLVEKYIEKNDDWLSIESREILRYFARHIRRAAVQSPTNMSISSAETAWMSKGFAGAINFSLFYGSSTLRMDIVPCIISTSSMNKVLIAQGLPVLLNRGISAASDEKKKKMSEFYDEVNTILLREIPGVHVPIYLEGQTV